jgi:hypothetical protein
VTTDSNKAIVHHALPVAPSDAAALAPRADAV